MTRQIVQYFLLERCNILVSFLFIFLACTLRIMIRERSPQPTSIVAKSYCRESIALAAFDDTLYTSSPCFDFTCTEESVGNIWVVGHASVGGQQGFDGPAFGQYATIDNLQHLIGHSDLDGRGICIVFIDACIEQGLPQCFSRYGEGFYSLNPFISYNGLHVFRAEQVHHLAYLLKEVAMHFVLIHQIGILSKETNLDISTRDILFWGGMEEKSGSTFQIGAIIQTQSISLIFSLSNRTKQLLLLTIRQNNIMEQLATIPLISSVPYYALNICQTKCRQQQKEQPSSF